MPRYLIKQDLHSFDQHPTLGAQTCSLGNFTASTVFGRDEIDNSFNVERSECVADKSLHGLGRETSSPMRRLQNVDQLRHWSIIELHLLHPRDTNDLVCFREHELTKPKTRSRIFRVFFANHSPDVLGASRKAWRKELTDTRIAKRRSDLRNVLVGKLSQAEPINRIEGGHSMPRARMDLARRFYLRSSQAGHRRYRGMG